MTPSVLAMFDDLEGLSDDLELNNNLSFTKTSKDFLESKFNQGHETDFSADNSDSDYVPNNEDDAESDDSRRCSNQQGSKYVPETESSSDSEDENLSVQVITVPATAHSSGEQLCGSDQASIYSSETMQGRPKKGRKRKHPDHTVKEAKARKYQNLPYQRKTKKVAPKVFKSYKCKCKKKCQRLVATEIRSAAFNKFVVLGSYEAQLLYIVNHIKEIPKVRSYSSTQAPKTNKKRSKEYSRKYFIDNFEVCRDMFINNFQITSKRVDVSLKKFRSGQTLNDQRGQKSGGLNKIPDLDVDFIRTLINRLPKYESHYRRDQNSGCQYLKFGMTIQKIYDIYLDDLKTVFGAEKIPVSFGTLKRIFYKYFNLRFKPLKKDTCNRCDILANKIKSCCSAEEMENLLKEKNDHLERAEGLRKQMNKDILRAKTDPKFEVLTFDLEKTLPLPRIPTNIVFYKRQLWFYNSGIHQGSNNVGHCYVWVEGEAGRGAQEVGSCLNKFIKEELKSEVEHLVLWSDCCGGQNRNIKIVLMLKVILASHPNLKTITLKYLESGHTFLPNDTDFSKIEYQLKFRERIYTAEEYMSVIKECKRVNPLQVHRMKTTDFYSVSNIEKKITNRKVFITKEKASWLKTKEILLKKDKLFSIFMRSDPCSDKLFEEIDISKKTKGPVISFSEADLILLWPDGKEIPQAKLDDLRSMFDLIPKDCLPFYQNLKGNADLIEDVDGYNAILDFNIDPIENFDN